MLASRQLSRCKSAIARRDWHAVTRVLGRHSSSTPLAALDRFEPRHLGPRSTDLPEMLATIGVSSVGELIEKTVPSQIRLSKELDLGPYSPGLSESAAIAELQRIASGNEVARSFIGMGYYDTKTPYVILRNVLENPGWYAPTRAGTGAAIRRAPR
jgi:glycine dehydrogenase